MVGAGLPRLYPSIITSFRSHRVIIDFHYHSGQRSIEPEDLANPITWSRARPLRGAGVDKVVMLGGSGVGTPECTFNAHFLYYPGMSLREEVLKAKEYPDRIIPFGCMDVRWMGNRPDADFSPLLDWFQEQGCRGIGEVTSNVPIDDPRTVNMFRQCGQRGLPVLATWATSMAPTAFRTTPEPRG